MQHDHNWASVGLWEDKTRAVYPCLVPDCPAALLRVPGQDIATGEVLADRFPQNGLRFEDDPTGSVVKIIQAEIEENYKFNTIKFRPGDVVIDSGAHVGVVSVWLAKRHPDIIVYAFEPIPANFTRLISNLKANGVDNVIAFNQGLSSDGRRLSLRVNMAANSAAASEYVSDETAQVYSVPTKTLADVFSLFDIDRLRLLKIDSEGAEYDILLNTPADILSRIDYIRGEFHTNKRLKKAGYKPAALRKFLRGFGIKVSAGSCKMAE